MIALRALACSASAFRNAASALVTASPERLRVAEVLSSIVALCYVPGLSEGETEEPHIPSSSVAAASRAALAVSKMSCAAMTAAPCFSAST